MNQTVMIGRYLMIVTESLEKYESIKTILMIGYLTVYRILPFAVSDFSLNMVQNL